MQYTSLGRCGLQVSRSALGTMTFGELPDEPASFAIMNGALEAGINFLDAADVYGGPQRPEMENGFGISEKIRIDVAGTSVATTVDDTAAAKDFVSLLPLTLTLEDYNRTEKISDLAKKLSTQDAPAGVEPSRGDIAYYAPWSNLAIFYKDFPYSRGLVKLGRIESGIEMFEQAGALTVTLRRVDD